VSKSYQSQDDFKRMSGSEQSSNKNTINTATSLSLTKQTTNVSLGPEARVVRVGVRVELNWNIDRERFLGMITAYLNDEQKPGDKGKSVILEFGIVKGEMTVSSRAGQIENSEGVSDGVWDISAFPRDQWTMAVAKVKRIIETHGAGTCFFGEGKMPPASDQQLTDEVLEVVDYMNNRVLEAVEWENSQCGVSRRM
jgi:hypothetical protein